MSKSKIKIGRYSKARHTENKNTVAMIEQKKTAVPYLINFTDCQDVTILCHNSFSPFLNIDWKNEINNFHVEFPMVKKCLNQNFFTKNQYMDIKKITGVEIDHRKVFTKFCVKLMAINFRIFIRALKNLPGINELSHEEFISAFLQQKEDLELTSILNSLNVWEGDILKMSFGPGLDLHVTREQMSSISDTKITEMHMNWAKQLDASKLSFEELSFLLALNALRPTSGKRHFQIYYDRFVLAFTRFLESRYGNSYHIRLQELIDLMVTFKLRAKDGAKWMTENEDYINNVYDSDFMKMFINDKKVPNIVSLFKDFGL